MTRLQSIQNGLSSINPAAFQDLCDSFLARRNRNYAAYLRTGSQSGKQKTVKGTPDALILLPNGKYILVEHSTDVSKGIGKILNDIKKCLTPQKTNIPLSHIAEIIICLNFNLKPVDIVDINNLLVNTRIKLTIITRDSLALELHMNHRDLAHQYLGISLDSGQIVSIKQFLAEHNKISRGFFTPLDNPIMFREAELAHLRNSINSNDFIVLTGQAGIGKTRLALEAIHLFIEENKSFTAYCISYKSHDLLEDLYQHFDTNSNYILFVDDANRIDAFTQIIGFYKSFRIGKFKLIITVRDYAYLDISELCQEYSPLRIDINKLSDEQILTIIKAPPFNILNHKYHSVIKKISNGNPRIAILTALLAKSEQNIYALYDVSDLFDKLYSTFIKDDKEFSNTINIKCLGLIAFFYTIPYKDKDITENILKNFGISYIDFIDVIDKLDKLQLLEIQFEYVKISEQNLSTYYFYKTFIKDSILPFTVLLEKYFATNTNRFRDCIIPAHNMFGGETVTNQIKPALQSYWKNNEWDDESAYKYLSSFWYYLKDETLRYLINLVESLPVVSTDNYTVTYENNAFSYNRNKVIELLGQCFRYHSYIREFIEIGFEYARKVPNEVPELIHKIREVLTFDEDDELTQYLRQSKLFEIILVGVNNNDKLLISVFFELSKTFLAFKYHQTRNDSDKAFIFYDYPIKYSQAIKDIRKNIWTTIDMLFDNFPNQAFVVLNSYQNTRPDVVAEILEYDIPFIINIIENHLTNESFEHCKYVQDQIRWSNRHGVSNASFKTLANKFTNRMYEVYLKLDWDRLRDKDSYEFNNYDEYRKLKETEIRESIRLLSIEEMNIFYEQFRYLIKISSNAWNYFNSLDIIIDEKLNNNFESGIQLLLIIIQNGNEINYNPRWVWINHLNNETKAKLLWKIINDNDFNIKPQWELSYYECLADSLINENIVNSILHTMRNIQYSHVIRFDGLVKYLNVKPHLFEKILEILTDRNEIEESRLEIWTDFFDTYYDKLGGNIELIKKAYLQQNKLQSHFDYEGKGLIKILKVEPKYLIEFVNSLYTENNISLSRESRNLGIVWQIVNIEPIIEDVITLIIEKEPYLYFDEGYCNSFFKDVPADVIEISNRFIYNYCEKYYGDYKRINIIVDIIRHSRKSIFEKFLLYYLTLTQDVNLFSKISWRGNSTSGVGDIILSDIEAADWKQILSIVEKSDVGAKLIPIKLYLNDLIEGYLKSGDWERRQRFIER